MDNDDIQPLTVTVEQAARLLGIGRSTAYELVHTGAVPSLRLGRRIVVPVGRITQMLEADLSDTAPSGGADRAPAPALEASPALF